MHNKCPQQLYEQAEQAKSFKCLLPYPCLLFRWQKNHPEDLIRIATIASHRTGKHIYCETPEKCQKVLLFLQEYGTTKQQIPLSISDQTGKL